MLSLASDCGSLDRLAEAETLSRQAFETSRRTLGADHPTTLRAIYNLGCSAALRGDHATAFVHLREAIDGGWPMTQGARGGRGPRVAARRPRIQDPPRARRREEARLTAAVSQPAGRG
jgi:hypothetical protein